MHTNIKKWTFAFVIVCFAHHLNAQNQSTGNWFIYFGNQAINKKWNWWNEVQYRNYNFAGDLEQLMLRTGIGYNLTENNNNLLLGYAHIISAPYIAGTNTKTNTTEERLYQQFITKQNFGRFFLQHRYRLEERFLSSGEFKARFRYFLSINIAINKPSIVNNTFYFSAYNEFFLNFKSPVFDRDRLYGAVGYALTDKLRLETGYMIQMYEKQNRPQFQLVFMNNLPIHNK
ncbi:MAG: Uncharacterized protein FD136_1349 [Chitinophagaceae bacterium]|nr:MAG: Uncharacterized protein FD136_1349 [Chitinophagaceae bacterium]